MSKLEKNINSNKLPFLVELKKIKTSESQFFKILVALSLLITIFAISTAISHKTKKIGPTPTGFEFIDENTLTYSCIPKFEVESDTPELSASQLYSQECFDQKTKEGCLAVDIYRESTKNFGNSDSIGDCKWRVQ